MPVAISMLRGVNVGGNCTIRMDALRALYASLKLKDAQTYIQSGNVVFRTTESDLPILAARIEKRIEREFGFRPSVLLRTAAEMRDVIARNPFAGRGIDPAKLLVMFLPEHPAAEIRDAVLSLGDYPEELSIDGRELYIYFPNGQGKSKLPGPLDKALRRSGTGRNWNSVLKLSEMAEKLESA
jgi:uncharacterized protein (DUF1697 family)